MGVCPLCRTAASCNVYRDFVDVRCATCGDFVLTRLAMEELGDEHAVKAELGRQTRAIARSGGRAFLGADAVATVRKQIGGCGTN